LLLIVGIISLVLVLAQLLINDFEEVIISFLERQKPLLILSLFLTSETLFGLIPPDFFIVWANTFEHNMILLTVLAVLSYSGGIIAHSIGYNLRKIPKVYIFFERRFSGHYSEIEKFGSILIVISALFPLPYSTITMVAGAMKYPVKKLFLFGIARILRFYIYAIFLFKIF
jgi:membrane protein YqaA with SNARE-associated domain